MLPHNTILQLSTPYMTLFPHTPYAQNFETFAYLLCPAFLIMWPF